MISSAKHYIQKWLTAILAFLRRQENFYYNHMSAAKGLLAIGRHTYGCPQVQHYRGSERKVVIGSFCSISPDVVIVTGGNHPSNWVSTFPFRIRWNMDGAYRDGMPASRGDVVIGNDVWIGTNAMILSGVTIGDGVVIGARSVVTRDIPPYAIAVGNPARIVRYRFSPEQIEKLLAIAWWNWNDVRIRDAASYLNDDDIERFFKYAEAKQP